MLADLRYAFRQILRSPGFTAAVVTLLAFGIGINTALFTAATGALQQPLAGVQQPERLAWVVPFDPRWNRAPRGLSYPDLLDYQRRGDVFDGVAAVADMSFSLLPTRGEPQRVQGQAVSGNFFALLGTPMALGRGLSAADDQIGGEPTVVLAHSLWRERFDGDSAIVGRGVTINARLFRVVGVAPERFSGLQHGRHELWIPLQTARHVMPHGDGAFTSRQDLWLTAFGRLRTGVTVDQATIGLRRVASDIAAVDSAGHGTMTVQATPAATGGGPQVARFDLAVPLTATVTILVLLVACANVSNLLLGRAIQRRREIAVRLSLGASRQRVVRQLLVESLVLSTLAAAAIMFMLFTALSVIEWKFGIAIPTVKALPTVGFAFGVSVLTTLLFGIVPAASATGADVAASLRTGTSGLDKRRSRLQRGFVVAQLACSMMLLVVTGMFLRTLDKAQRKDPGFSGLDQLVTASFDLGMQQYTRDQTEAFLTQLEAEIRAVPSVRDVGFVDHAPFTGASGMRELMTLGHDAGTKGDSVSPYQAAFITSVRPGYFRTLGIPLLQGRDFAMSDAGHNAPAIVVSADFARQAWPGQNPLGQRVVMNNPNYPYVVIGVVGATTTVGMDYDQAATVYFAERQGDQPSLVSVVVRSEGNTSALRNIIRQRVRLLDRSLPVFGVTTLAAARLAVNQNMRSIVWLFGGLGLIALLVAAIGLYTVMAVMVLLRTRDIGIRLAIGATGTQVTGLFLRQGLRMSLIGVGVGLALSLVMAHMVSAMVFGIVTADWTVFAGVTALLVATALVASWFPAQRAVRVDPLVALRTD